MRPDHLARRIVAPLALVGVLIASFAGSALADAPSVTTMSFHRVAPDYVQCPNGSLEGSWDITRVITIFTDANGTPVRDTWRIRFTGIMLDPATGASVTDSGERLFIDQLAPDGSILSTMFMYQRTNPYVHEAGQQLLGPADENGDQDVLRQVGHDGFTDANIAAACSAFGLG